MVFSERTDLASEARRLWEASPKRTSSLCGVEAREETLYGFPVDAVQILDREGAAALGKPPGLYFTLELERFFSHTELSFSEAAQALAVLIRRCLPTPGPGPALVAALGNPDITPDALGPLCAEKVLATRHLLENGGELFRGFFPVALCRTGVLGTSGMESALQIRALCDAMRPSCVLVVDALAGADSSRLCRTVQVCSSGIAPGSGVGNDREAITPEALGLPVVALGVPTVIDASFFAPDEALRGLFVTPRDIDVSVRRAARLIASAINLALHRGLSLEELNALIE